MNILFYLYNYPSLGGIEKVTTCLANYFNRKGHRVYIYSFNSNYSNVLLSELNSGVCCYLKQRITLSSIVVENELRDILCQKKIDCIIFQDSYQPIEGCLFAALYKLSQKPILIIAEHNTPDCFIKSLRFETKKKYLYPIYYLRRRFYVQKRLSKLYKECDRYILLSESFIPIWEKMSKIQRHSKLLWINNPITVSPSESFIEGKEKICLFSGRFSPQKSVLTLLKIWEKVAGKHRDWKLVLIGDGEERGKIETFIKKHSLNNSVILEGFTSNVEKYYRKASILTMTSIYEGWLLSLVEAMNYSCVPILFNSYLSVRDIVKDMDTGILVSPFNIDAYAEKLDYLMDEKNEMIIDVMRAKAFESSKRFRIERIGDIWCNLIETIGVNKK